MTTSSLPEPAWNPIDSFAGNYTQPELMAHRPCPVCGLAQSTVATQFHDFQFFTDSSRQPKRADLIQHQCLNCHALYLNPCYTPHGFSMLFAEAGQSYGTSRGPEQVEWLQSQGFLKPGSSLLDAGCYDGRFLSLIPATVKRMGVDIDGPAIERGKKNFPELHLIHGDFETFQCQEAPDTITMFHALEHLPNPVPILKHLRATSRETTRLVIEVPILEKGFNQDINGFFSFQHLTHFSRASLRNTFVRAGWEIRDWIEQPDYNGCRVVATPAREPAAIKSEPGDVAKLHEFLSHWHRSLASVAQKMNALSDETHCVIWGAGMHTEFLYHTTGLFHSQPARNYVIVDGDPLKLGRTWRGILIQKPDMLKRINWKSTALIISSYGSQESMAAAALQMGVPAERIIKLYSEVHAY